MLLLIVEIPDLSTLENAQAPCPIKKDSPTPRPNELRQKGVTTNLRRIAFLCQNLRQNLPPCLRKNTFNLRGRQEHNGLTQTLRFQV